MPRPRKPLLERLAPADLAYAVDRLVAAGKATINEVVTYAAERPARIAQLERELKALRVGLVGVVKPGPGPRAVATAKPSVAAPRRKRKFTMTPKMAAARKLQGRYLGLLRSLDASGKAAVKKIAQSKGVAAAVKEAESRRKRG